MAENSQSKDEALEAVDFIVSVLKEHEKDLDKLISELSTVTEQLGNKGELSNKVEKIEEKISLLQKDITNLIGYVSNNPKKEETIAIKPSVNQVLPPPPISIGPSVILRCQQWEDFQQLAQKAQTLSFSYKEGDNSLFVNALNGNQIITYSGVIPKLSAVLKVWLSKQLDVSERNILEGVLGLS